MSIDKDWIRKKALYTTKKYNTNDPYKLCKFLGIDLRWDNLGKNIMGYRTRINRIPSIILNITNTEDEAFTTCCHEIGHHCCGHNMNTGYLKRSNLNTSVSKVEFEANTFMVEMLLDGKDLSNVLRKEQVMEICGIPDWAERYVDWEYTKKLINTSHAD